MNHRKFNHAYRSVAGDDGVGGGGAAPGAGEGNPGAAPAGAAGEGTPPGGLAGAAAAPPASTVPPVVDDWKGAPEKYQVKREDGTIDEAATLKKVDQARAELEKRMGAGGLPPASPEEYTIDPAMLPEGITAEILKADPLFQEYAKEAHAAGMTDAQLSLNVKTYYSRLESVGGAYQELSDEEAFAEISKVWPGGKDEVTNNLRVGFQALKAFGAEGDAETIGSFERLQTKFGNDPDFWVFANRVGKELGEDKSINGQGGAGDTSEMDTEALMKTEAYRNPNDPQHAATKAKVTAFFERKYAKK